MSKIIAVFLGFAFVFVPMLGVWTQPNTDSAVIAVQPTDSFERTPVATQPLSSAFPEVTSTPRGYEPPTTCPDCDGGEPSDPQPSGPAYAEFSSSCASDEANTTLEATIQIKGTWDTFLFNRPQPGNGNPLIGTITSQGVTYSIYAVVDEDGSVKIQTNDPANTIVGVSQMCPKY